MRYDKLGFPVPTEFEPLDLAPAGGEVGSSRRGLPDRHRPGRGKRFFLLAVLLGIVVPAIVVPAFLPTIRDLVVQVSLDLAIRREGRGALPDAITHLTRAIRWGETSLDANAERKSDLLCWRAMLRIGNRDLAGALRDAELAASIAPTAVEPHRVRALAEVIRGNPEAALAAAQTVVELAGRTNPEALNHRAYIRALVGRDLDQDAETVRALCRQAARPAGMGTLENIRKTN